MRARHTAARESHRAMTREKSQRPLAGYVSCSPDAILVRGCVLPGCGVGAPGEVHVVPRTPLICLVIRPNGRGRGAFPVYLPRNMHCAPFPKHLVSVALGIAHDKVACLRALGVFTLSRGTHVANAPPDHLMWSGMKKQCKWIHLHLCGIHHSWWPFGLHEASAEQLAIWSAAWPMWTKCHLVTRFFQLVTNFSPFGTNFFQLVTKWNPIWSTFSHLVSRLANVDQMPFGHQIFPVGDQLFSIWYQLFPVGHQMEFQLVHIFTIWSADSPTW